MHKLTWYKGHDQERPTVTWQAANNVDLSKFSSLQFSIITPNLFRRVSIWKFISRFAGARSFVVMVKKSIPASIVSPKISYCARRDWINNQVWFGWQSAICVKKEKYVQSLAEFELDKKWRSSDLQKVINTTLEMCSRNSLSCMKIRSNFDRLETEILKSRACFENSSIGKWKSLVYFSSSDLVYLSPLGPYGPGCLDMGKKSTAKRRGQGLQGLNCLFWLLSGTGSCPIDISFSWSTLSVTVGPPHNRAA